MGSVTSNFYYRIVISVVKCNCLQKIHAEMVQSYIKFLYGVQIYPNVFM